MPKHRFEVAGSWELSAAVRSLAHAKSNRIGWVAFCTMWAHIYDSIRPKIQYEYRLKHTHTFSLIRIPDRDIVRRYWSTIVESAGISNQIRERELCSQHRQNYSEIARALTVYAADFSSFKCTCKQLAAQYFFHCFDLFLELKFNARNSKHLATWTRLPALLSLQLDAAHMNLLPKQNADTFVSSTSTTTTSSS